MTYLGECEHAVYTGVMTELNLEVSKKLVDLYLRRMLAERKVAAAEVGPRYELFWQRIADVLLAGGKRIRPHLTMIGYGEIDKRLVPIAAAQELLHVAMLMHDDVIDKDDVRHGVFVLCNNVFMTEIHVG